MLGEWVGVGIGWTERRKGHSETVRVVWKMLMQLAMTEELEAR